VGLVAETQISSAHEQLPAAWKWNNLCINWKLLSKELVDDAHRKGMARVCVDGKPYFSTCWTGPKMGVDSIITD